jgi:hypothetical protein
MSVKSTAIAGGSAPFTESLTGKQYHISYSNQLKLIAVIMSTRRCAWPQFVWGTDRDPAFSLEESRSVAHQFLFHRTGDHAGVVGVDIGREQMVAGVFMDTVQIIEVVSLGRPAGPQDRSDRSCHGRAGD